MKVVQLENAHFHSPRIDEQIACPNCGARAMLRQDRTIICHAEGVAVIPEPGDEVFDKITLILGGKNATGTTSPVALDNPVCRIPIR